MRRVTVCPSCAGTRIVHDTSNPLEGPLGLPERLMCKDCGHIGYTFPTMPEQEVTTYKKHASTKKNTAVDVSYGNFAVRALWKVTSPTLFVLGAIILFAQPLIGSVLMLVATAMMYITYVTKRSLKPE